jgi:hypothetical protein
MFTPAGGADCFITFFITFITTGFDSFNLIKYITRLRRQKNMYIHIMAKRNQVGENVQKDKNCCESWVEPQKYGTRQYDLDLPMTLNQSGHLG